MPRSTFCSMLLLTALTGQLVCAQEGQYRSKILIDPGSALDEGIARSAQDMERQLESMSDPYAIATTSRQLARHYLQRKEFDKAAAWYRAALQADGLSPLADREMLRELAQVYLLQKDYAAATEALEQVLQFELVPEPDDFLLLAESRHQQGDYVGVVAVLEQLQQRDLGLDALQLRRILALYYQAGAYPQCAGILQQLLVLEGENPEYWHQLAAIYLLQDKRRAALDQLVLAHTKGVPFRKQDIELLADLYAANGNPYAAASLLQTAVSRGQLDGDAQTYRKQFEFWLQAREQEQAITALAEAARLSGDTELYLYLAQLYGENEAWQAMQDTVLAACVDELDDKYVSRANLLLGISQLKLGAPQSARRSFINATLIGGAGAEAARWLQFMEAEPPSPREARGIASPCYGSDDKRRKLAAREDEEDVAGVTVANQPEASQAVIATKTVAEQRLYTATYRMTPEAAAREALSLATRLAVSLVRAGGEVDGPLQLQVKADVVAPDEPVDIQFALPTRANPRSSGRNRVVNSRPFRCAYLIYEGAVEGIAQAWAELARSTSAAGYTLSGDARYVFSATGQSKDRVVVELQLGIVAE